ncbi:MAG TPA: plastocyanin/azurin family copper-binding protein [Solirubrobacterales bacterium]|nr:plastocyanin/azurin family copper-binding protein [Solirubrobacterales bacterium]
MKKLAALFAVLIAALALAACGGGDDTTSDTTAEAPTTQEESGGGEKEAEGGTAGAATFDVEADPSGALAFTTDEATAKAGKVTVNFTNSSPVPHDVRIEGSGGEEIGGTEVLSEGSESATVDLKPGEYTFFCSVPGHRQGGMEGTLTVK